jgi:4-hydroxy-tetrahydrodipicolinate synthase
MSVGQFRGIFTIPVTPFDDTGALDLRSFGRCLEFCVECGAHGIVAPVNASEFFTLSDSERGQVVKTMVRVVNHAVPVVAGITGMSPQHAVELASRAEQAGCESLIAMPPSRPISQPEIYEYYQALSKAVHIPIFIQNYEGVGGTRMTAEFVARLVRELDHVDYVKEETLPPGPMMTDILKLAGDRCKGVMGGHGCAYLLEEYARGACGNMPAAHITDALVLLWNKLESGNQAEARGIFNRMLPLFNVERLYGTTVYKWVLHKRGVIKSPHLRIPRRRGLDEHVLRELTLALHDIDDLLTCRKHPVKV